MRVIKFRGICPITGEMKYGFGVNMASQTKLVDLFKTSDSFKTEIVTKESVGQFTGLTDRNGKEIYEGDILSMNNGQYNSVIIWDLDHFNAKHDGNGGIEYITTFLEDHTVIGNVHQNPEMLTPPRG